MRATKNKTSNRSFKKLTKRLGAYSAAAAATAVTAVSANAAEIVWDIPDVTAGSSPGLLFNVLTGATANAAASTGNNAAGSFRLASFGGNPYIAGPAGSTIAGFVGPGSFGPNDFYPDRLPAGDIVSSLDNFGAENDGLQYGPYGYLSANFTNDRGFVGLQFAFGGNTHYGWAEITHLGSGNGTTLHAFGFNDAPGAPSVIPSAIPEPNSMALLAAGAAGAVAFRRRKNSG